MALRADRLATLYVFHPVASRLANGNLRIPVLMYHSVSNTAGIRRGYFQTTTSPARFAGQMRMLQEQGYTPVALSRAAGILAGSHPGPAKPVVITFDDGYRDFHTEAFPVLAAHGFAASMFLPTGYIGDRRSSFNGLECLTWGEVRELDTAGVEFGSHTVSHPKLKELGSGRIEQELRGSKEAIEDKLGKPAVCFSYPYAFPEANRDFVARLKDILVACGYRAGVSTVIGSAAPSSDPLFLSRLPVNSQDDAALFRAKLEGGYDWLHGLQRLKKALAG